MDSAQISVYTHKDKIEDKVITGHGDFQEYPKTLPRDARNFWEKNIDGLEANGGIVIRKDRQVIAFCRYFYDEEEKILHTCGTWVESHERNQKYALKMWTQILATLPPKTFISAFTVSQGGRGLFSKLQYLHPQFDWDIDGCKAA